MNFLKRYLTEFYLNVFLFVLSGAIGLWYASNGNHDIFSREWLRDISFGSFIVMFFGNFVLRTVAAKTREKTESQTDIMHKLAMEKKTVEDEDSRFKSFIHFLENFSQYDILLPDITKEGLKYNISPVRDESGKPLIYSDEIRTLYLIKVNEISHYSVLDDEKLKEYDGSPIKVSEYYFCSFSNGFWHMCESTFGTKYKFFKFGMIGQVQSGISANEYVDPIDLSGHEKISTVIIDEEGCEASSGDAFTVYKRLTDGEVFVQFNRSPLKRIFHTSGKNQFGKDVQWHIQIDYADGYGSNLRIEKLKEFIIKILNTNKIELKKIPWYQNSREMKRSY